MSFFFLSIFYHFIYPPCPNKVLVRPSSLFRCFPLWHYSTHLSRIRHNLQFENNTLTATSENTHFHGEISTKKLHCRVWVGCKGCSNIESPYSLFPKKKSPYSLAVEKEANQRFRKYKNRKKKKDKYLVNEMVNILCLFIISCCFLRCDQAVYVLQQPNRTNVEKHRQP